MAHWCSIKVTFDAPVPEETLQILEAEFAGMDYDFPPGCLRYDQFMSYRHPIINDADVVALFLKHGVTGRWWITGSDDPDQAAESDGDCVVFRPGVEPDSIAKAHRVKLTSDAVERDAKRYVAITKAFNIPALPVVWEAAEIMHCYTYNAHDAFTAEVLRLTKETP